MRYRNLSPARSWLMLQNAMKWILERDKTPSYLEPWQRVPIDPTIEHIVVFELEAVETPWRRRVTCSCGLDLGWQSPNSAVQDAHWHREEVRRLKLQQGLDSLPVPLIERRHTSAGLQFRRTCNCGNEGEWLVSEPVAALSSMLHFQECEERTSQREIESTQRQRERERLRRRR